jgi:hypothetical protein
MTLRTALVACLLLVAPLAQAGPREELLGRWRSDRSTTLAKLVGHPKITAEQRALLEEILGELVIEYEEAFFTAHLDDWTETRPYEVVAEGSDFVDLRSYDAVMGKTIQRRVWVEGTRMWLWVEGIGFYEHFERLP